MWIESLRGAGLGAVLGVTPLAGVWIESGSGVCGIGGAAGSLPLRECGLKDYLPRGHEASQEVTPLAGVWIESW